MSFTDLMSGFKEKTSELKNEIMKFKNKKFLNATTAGAALIAMADGVLSPEEKKKMIKFIESNDALSVFKTQEVILSFKKFIENFEFDKEIGESKAYEALNHLRGNEIECRTVMRLILSIAAADGIFDDSEKIIAKRIAVELNLNPSDFEL